jgi:REP element-mobilizing transposase RayT
MQKTEKLAFGSYYHIYNRGINSCNLFREKENYEYFLNLYDQYISPVAETFAWVLMPNHFHFLVRIKDESEIIPDLTGFQNLSGLVKLKPPHQHFSNLFNAYTKAVNKRYFRHGALFERPFQRKKIDDADHLRQVILYIHHNPVHHNFCELKMDYPWSSYLTCVSVKPTKLHRESVLGWFDHIANFKYMHNQRIDVEMIEDWLFQT